MLKITYYKKISDKFEIRVRLSPRYCLDRKKNSRLYIKNVHYLSFHTEFHSYHIHIKKSFHYKF